VAREADDKNEIFNWVLAVLFIFLLIWFFDSKKYDSQIKTDFETETGKRWSDIKLGENS
jgi:hypothetical protein